MLISDKVDLRAKKVTMGKEGNYTIKRTDPLRYSFPVNQVSEFHNI